MSFKHRLNKLEQRYAEFVVSWPVYLDGAGNKIAWCSDINEDAVEAVTFKGSRDGGYTVDRLKDEKFEDFKTRAHRDAAEKLSVTVFLLPGSEDL